MTHSSPRCSCGRCTVHFFLLGVVLAVSLGTVSVPRVGYGYICDVDKIGDISVKLEKIPVITDMNTPFQVAATFENRGDVPITMNLRAYSISPFAVQLETDSIVIPAKGKIITTMECSCENEKGNSVFTAHYPIHLIAEGNLGGDVNGQKITLHPVQVFETNFGVAGSVRKPVGNTATGKEVFRGDTITDTEKLPVIIVPEQGGVALSQTSAYRIVWQRDKEKKLPKTVAPVSGENVSGKEILKDRDTYGHVLPIGWTGNEETSRVSFQKIPMVRGGVNRHSFAVHPPYNGGVGDVWAEWKITLPQTTPILFSTFGAMRDLNPTEPESDGVTFTVWVDTEKVAAKHFVGRDWVPFEVDLTRFAGKTVLLRLQTDPGPRRDTTCDSAFWGSPLIFAGKPPVILDRERKKTYFSDTNPHGSAVCFGNYGFLDGVIFAAGAAFDGVHVEIDGQPLCTENSTVAFEPWVPVLAAGESSEILTSRAIPLIPCTFPKNATYHFTQKVYTAGRELEMRYMIRSIDNDTIQLSVDCSEPSAVTKVELGPILNGVLPERVYFGHGYCVTEPERFEINGGGHYLSTSYVGFDMKTGGQSLLLGSSFPPNRFIVDPEAAKYTLSMEYPTTLTLVSGPYRAAINTMEIDSYRPEKNAMDCAIRYRDINEKKAAPGVTKKAGRFVFDVWGGRFTEHTEKLQQQIDYGVTDSLFINHNWQRWGYDNRLPDIWPPNPQRGTLAEMKTTLDLCTNNGILYGLHDNYIDIYPDAEGYSFDVVSFEENGVPRKAWNNYGIQAQSYQLRPDTLAPFLAENFKKMTAEFPQTTYFVDVFASTAIRSFWDNAGNRHSPAEMVDHWKRAFDFIRDQLGENNPTISEAGSDFLIGHLDGSDCQFMFLSDRPGEHRVFIRCKKWARVPWFDAVHHTRFSLHGVGYDTRYVTGRGNLLHGYSSDDYISAEILTGHSLQVGWNQMGRESVRKYWLAQPVAKLLADCEITQVSVPEGSHLVNDRDRMEYHRDTETLCIRWNHLENQNKWAHVRVNRGKDNSPYGIWGTWYPKGDNRHSSYLPQYGYHAFGVNGTGRRPEDANVFSIVMKIPVDTDLSVPHDKGSPVGVMIEYSKQTVETEVNNTRFLERQVYFNPRQVGTDALPILPQSGKFNQVAADSFTLEIDWKVLRPLEKYDSVKTSDGVKNYHWFLHLEPPRRNWHEKLEMTNLDGGKLETPVSQWKTDQRTKTAVITVPSQLASGTYQVLVGLWDMEGDKNRAKLLGPSPDNSRILLGTLTVMKQGNSISGLKFDSVTDSADGDSLELFARQLPPEPETLAALVSAGSVRGRGALRFGHPIPLISTGGVQLRYPVIHRFYDVKFYPLDTTDDRVQPFTVTPLPQEPDTTVVLDVHDFYNTHGVKFTTCQSLTAVNREGKTIRNVEFTLEDGELRFQTRQGEFAYQGILQ